METGEFTMNRKSYEKFIHCTYRDFSFFDLLVYRLYREGGETHGDREERVAIQSIDRNPAERVQKGACLPDP